MEGKWLLLVEDDALIRLLMVDVFSDADFEVIEAEDGDHAFQKLEQLDRLDLLFTNIQMPGRADGNAVATRVRECHPGVPVIYASGRPDSLTNKIEFGDAFLLKPYRGNEVLAVVARLLAISQSHIAERRP